MSPGRKTTVERDLQALLSWPKEWVVIDDGDDEDDEDGDLQAGRRIIEQLTGFVSHLHASGLAASTIRRHLDNLHLLGGTLIHDRHDNDPPKPVPDLIDMVEEEGGPLIDGGNYTAAQRSFDATCRKLYKFLNPLTKESTDRPSGKR